MTTSTIEKFPDPKPTVEELEAILASDDDRDITINPDGSITVNPAPAERSPEQQAVWEKAIYEAKVALGCEFDAIFDEAEIEESEDLDRMFRRLTDAIDAACLPEPEEEEIEVTEAMCRAGVMVFECADDSGGSARLGGEMRAIYTAMERQRRKDGKAEDEKKPPFDMRKFAEEGGSWDFEAGRPIDERRKDET